MHKVHDLWDVRRVSAAASIFGLRCNTPRTTSLATSGNIPVKICISSSLGTLTVPWAVEVGRAAPVNSVIHWRTIPLPPFCCPDSASEGVSGAGVSVATGGPARRVEGLVLARGVLAVLIASSMSDNASAAVARGSGRTRFVLLMGRFSPKMGAIQVCANLTDL